MGEVLKRGSLFETGFPKGPCYGPLWTLVGFVLWAPFCYGIWLF